MLEAVNVLSELEELGIEPEYTGDRSVKIHCPFHDDNSPSLLFYLESTRFECKACKAKGDIADFLARKTSRPRSDVVFTSKRSTRSLEPYDPLPLTSLKKPQLTSGIQGH